MRVDSFFRFLTALLILWGTHLFAIPAVTNVSPAQGPTSGGTTVSITGSGFTGATAVKFGTAAAARYRGPRPASLLRLGPARRIAVVRAVLSGRSLEPPKHQDGAVGRHWM